jgi:ATP-binding cassette subfamily F protein 3
MTVLSIRDLVIRLGGRALIEGADLTLDTGRKLGLVGRNGAGKSTLIRAITGELQPDGGDIRLAARARMGHVAQEAPGGEGSLLDAVLEADTERTACCASWRRAGAAARGRDP